MKIIVQDDDAAGFVDQVRTLVSNVVRRYQPRELFLIKTNTWFGPNWLRFAGKAAGAIGIWYGPKADNISVPPFVPHRILWERRYTAPNYRQIPIRRIVHLETSAANAKTRRVRDVAGNGSLIWYSGASLKNKRGSIMAYLLVNDSYWTWYTGWQFQESWLITKLCGASIEEIEELRNST
jgi:hypothetical protein